MRLRHYTKKSSKEKILEEGRIEAKDQNKVFVEYADGAMDIMPLGSDRPVEVSESDLLAAWAVLENLAVSIDQIGGFFGDSTESLGEDRRRALANALGSYLSVDLVRLIGEARTRLGRYIPDARAEALADSISYWDYAGVKP